MIILKFGGSSVGSPEYIKQVMRIIHDAKREHGDVVVVLSAFGGVTDQLIEMSKLASNGDNNYEELLKKLRERHVEAIEVLVPETSRNQVRDSALELLDDLRDVLHGVYLVRECSLRTKDVVMSFGERLSAYILAHALSGQDVESEFLDARKVVVTDERFGGAVVDTDKTYSRIKKYFAARFSLKVVTGFLGATLNGETTTLGRGGSDYTAALFGAALDAKRVEIWTDVDGVMSADPRKVKDAFVIGRLRYIEAAELSYFGAKIIHPPTIKPIQEKSIPIVIKNTFNPSSPGTHINTESRPFSSVVTGITSIDNIALLQLQGAGLRGVAGTAKRLFGAFSQKGINVIFITQASSEYSICAGFDASHTEEARYIVEKEFENEIRLGQVDPIVIDIDMSIIAVVGEDMRTTPGTAGRVFGALGEAHVNVAAIAQGSSELNISVVVSSKDCEKGLNVLHDAFFSSYKKEINVCLVGTGLVGSMLLSQIQAMPDDNPIRVKVVAVANSKRMLLDQEGINLSDWKQELDREGELSRLADFVGRVKELGIEKTVFVDCTASDEVAQLYEQILSTGISVVTPNKKANSGDFGYYRRLRELAKKKDVAFLYETNVGAALPIISTIRDLVFSGDKVFKIEGVLSGTLSYIFNTYVGDNLFSDVVRDARLKGYTEPDPREDLNGMDVARKLLILAREIGLSLELSDVYVENLIPESCRDMESVDDFFEGLEKVEKYFGKKKEMAEGSGKVLRYIGSIENGKAGVSLQSISKDHPFYSMHGSDNIISITSERYKDNPLVIKGPGAGAGVTAGGVLADIIRINK